MSHEVRVTQVAARPTAVVAAATTWQEFPALWKELLDEVWACLRAGGVRGGCRNVMLYLDELPVGPRWEVYGPHHDDPRELWTEIHYLLADR